MPKVALADTLSDWDRLLRAAESHAGKFPALGKLIEALRTDLDSLRRLDALRLRLTAERQDATQQLNEVRDHGKTAAISLRQQLMAEIGPRDEGLVEFGMTPLRRPRRRGRAVSASRDGAKGPASPTSVTGES